MIYMTGKANLVTFSASTTALCENSRSTSALVIFGTLVKFLLLVNKRAEE